MGRPKPERIGKTARRRAKSAGVISTSVTRKGFGVRWRTATTLAPSLDAVALVDHVSDVVLAQHYHAIGEGLQADESAPQPPLAAWGQAGRDAAEGRRPDVRGVTGLSSKPFRDNLERTAIKVKGKQISRSRFMRQRFGESGFIVNETVEGTRASTTIQPDRIHRNFVAIEAQKRQIQYLYVGGMVSEMVDRALAAWLDVGLEGVLAKADKRDRKALRSKTRK